MRGEELKQFGWELDTLSKQLNKEVEANNKMQFDIAVSEKQEEIDKLKNQIKQESNQEKNRYDQLLTNKSDMEKIIEINDVGV